MRAKCEMELEGETKEERGIMRGRGSGLKKTEGMMGPASPNRRTNVHR